jgi:hypothetical protein
LGSIDGLKIFNAQKSHRCILQTVAFFVSLAVFFKAVAFGVAFVVGGGACAAYGDASFVAVVFVVVEAAVGYAATNVLVRHDFSSLMGYNAVSVSKKIKNMLGWLEWI